MKHPMLMANPKNGKFDEREKGWREGKREREGGTFELV